MHILSYTHLICPTFYILQNEFKVSEREVTMSELQDLLKEGRLIEMFGCGTASAIAPIERIVFKESSGALVDLHLPTMKQHNPLFQRIFQFFIDVQLGRQKHSWAVEVQ